MVASAWCSNDGLSGDGVQSEARDVLEDDEGEEVTDDVDDAQDATDSDPYAEFAVVAGTHAESDRQTLPRWRHWS